MTWKKRLTVSAVAAASIGIGGVLAATPADASTPIPGISGCYMYSYTDFGYWTGDGAVGYCIMPMDSDRIFMQFDANGNYW